MASPGTPTPRAPQGWPHPLVAAALSAVIPGLGQLAAGFRRRGWWFVAITALFVLPAVVLFLMVFYVEGIDLAIDISRPFFEHPGLLLALLAANVTALAFRVMTAVDAYLLAGGSANRAFVSTAVGAFGLTLILFLTAVPRVIGSAMSCSTALTYDYATDPNQATTTTTPAPTTTTDGTSTTIDPGPTTTTLAATTTTTQPDPFAEGPRECPAPRQRRRHRRTGMRTDTMIVVSVDPETGWTAMFSIPATSSSCRSTRPPHIHCGRMGVGDRPTWPGAYTRLRISQPAALHRPNTGGDAAKVILGNLLGLDVDYFAMVDLQGFADVVDALGGVDITVTTRLYDPAYTIPARNPGDRLPPATITWGSGCLAYARSRTQSDDFNRMGRQRCVLEALARQSDPVELLRELPSLVPAIQASVITDIPIAQIPDFLDLLAVADLQHIVSIRLMPNAPEFAGTASSYVAYRISGYNVPNVPLIHERVDIARPCLPTRRSSLSIFRPG
jgi:LCP family protein required for cell wall assembly